jgi:HK97 family phage prohead protease
MSLSDVPMIVRSFGDADLSIRGDGRTIYGLAVPFGVSTSVRDNEGQYDEQFQRGAFAQTINRGALTRVKLRMLHDKASTNGVAVELREDAAGLIAAMRVSKTQRGDEMLELVRDGAFDQFSVGFQPVHTTWSDIGSVHGMRSTPSRGGSATRTEVALREISVVDFAAYDTALIGGVRSTFDASSLEPGAEPVEQPTEPIQSGASWLHIQNARALQQRLARLPKEYQ